MTFCVILFYYMYVLLRMSLLVVVIIVIKKIISKIFLWHKHNRYKKKLHEKVNGILKLSSLKLLIITTF